MKVDFDLFGGADFTDGAASFYGCGGIVIAALFVIILPIAILASCLAPTPPGAKDRMMSECVKHDTYENCLKLWDGASK